MTVINFDAPVTFDDPDTNWDGNDTDTQPTVTDANYRERRRAKYREQSTAHAYEE